MKLYILHEIGAPNHYVGLVYWAKKKNITIIFREFSILRGIAKGIRYISLDEVIKAFINLVFLFSLIFQGKKNIVIGIAPFDFRMLYLVKLFARHNLFYHTSHTTWTDEKVPKNTSFNKLGIIRKSWIGFIKKTAYCFCVTDRSNTELSSFFKIRKTKTVYHTSGTMSLPNLLRREVQLKEKSIINAKKVSICLYSGRLVEQKGVKKIIDLAVKLPDVEFRFAGKGPLESYLIDKSLKMDNLKILGYLDKDSLKNEYKNADILLLPSIKTATWEELFGISLIEAMSFGVVPFSSNHSGPLEVITHDFDGFVFSEDDFIELAYNTINILNSNQNKMYKLRINALDKSKKFALEKVSLLWSDILEKRLL